MNGAIILLTIYNFHLFIITYERSKKKLPFAIIKNTSKLHQKYPHTKKQVSLARFLVRGSSAFILSKSMLLMFFCRTSDSFLAGFIYLCFYLFVHPFTWAELSLIYLVNITSIDNQTTSFSSWFNCCTILLCDCVSSVSIKLLEIVCLWKDPYTGIFCLKLLNNSTSFSLSLLIPCLSPSFSMCFS